MLFENPSSPQLFFSRISNDNEAMWAPIIEKAWAKVKGNYLEAEHGTVKNSIHALVGVPVYEYSTSSINNNNQANTAYNRISAADLAGYIMTASTGTSTCGLTSNSFYSILCAFSITELDGTVVKMLLMRDPSGSVSYTGEWNKNDLQWTQDYANLTVNTLYT